ncbi:MAG: bifunctional hydroxymethylpyrimidine kinase/phosphomethylpyrimidine kinase [Spirochaetales bacterium]
MKTYKRLLTIAGSDSGGGAGIQADLKTFSALGCFGMSVVTALTAQNTRTVKAIHPVPPSFIREQIDALLEDIGVDAIKIGMLHSSEVIQTVARSLSDYSLISQIPVVVDPVMVAKGGSRLLEEEAIEALKTFLLPLATIITPNLPEAQVLLGENAPSYRNARSTSIGATDSLAYLEDLSRKLSALGSKAVLVKGGHLEGEVSTDILYLQKENKIYPFSSPRIQTGNTHGTGCTLSSALAAYLARGESIEGAVQKAKAYLTAALQKGAEYQLGKGHGPVHHFYNFWE